MRSSKFASHLSQEPYDCYWALVRMLIERFDESVGEPLCLGRCDRLALISTSTGKSSAVSEVSCPCGTSTRLVLLQLRNEGYRGRLQANLNRRKAP